MALAQREIYEEWLPEQQPKQQLKTKKRRKNRAKPIAVIIMLFLVFSALVAGHVHIINANNELLSMKKELSELQKTNEELKTELTMAENIQNIESTAIAELGMHYPDPSQNVYISIPSDKVAGETNVVVPSKLDSLKDLWVTIYGFFNKLWKWGF